ncbi:MAG: alcohol dehydrogenase catalytic domain-containing protein [Gemmatimonadetes bacterium]|nr:alcohol dehydrogenase catalytic domain-containing protein [Gemmatimonadota bacterium]
MTSLATALIFDGPGKPLRPAQIPLPAELASGSLLVEIELATLCGSDLHTISGQRTEPTPAILGHEAVGRIVAGSREGADIGDRITWSIADSCGSCPACTEHHLPEKCHSLFKYGHASLEDGSGLNGCYASHILLRSGTHIVRIPDALRDAVVAPVNCALATAVNAVSHLPPNCRTVLVQGAGLLGIYTCALLCERDVERIFCLDVQETRLARVTAFGGIPLDGSPERYPDSRSQIEAAAPHGVDAVVEMAGSAGLVPEGVRLLRPGGAYIFVGMVHPGTHLELTGEQIIRKCLTIRGVHNYSPLHLDGAVAFLEETAGRYPYESLVGPPFPLDELEQAVQAARTREHFRVSVRPVKARGVRK